VIGPAVSWAAAVQSAEALKILLGKESDLHGALVAYDLWSNRFQQVKTVRDPQCPVCVAHEYAYLEQGGATHVSMCGRNSVQIHPSESRGLDLAELRARLEPFGRVQANDFLLKCAIDPYELTVFPDGRVIVKGTHDPAIARGLYARYISA
jgi:adenylyltransferase/sulfurtransferase